jgi:cell division protein FtsB
MSRLSDEFAAEEQRMRKLMAESDALQRQIEEIRLESEGRPVRPKEIIASADIVEIARKAECS